MQNVITHILFSNGKVLLIYINISCVVFFNKVMAYPSSLSNGKSL